MDTYISKKLTFEGAATALVTPFKGGEIDFDAFRHLVNWQADMGISALCVAGTTGESATLGQEERKKLITVAKENVKDLPVIAGCGSASTETACSYCRDAVECGADALLVITPYCNKGTKSGVTEHFKRVADAAGDLSIILYNVPARTGVDLSLEQCLELSQTANICAIKEASSNFTKITRLAGESNLAVYSGNDDMILPVISVGGSGVISVLSNVLPAEVDALTRAALSGDTEISQKLAHRYAHLIELLFIETNPAPVKYACELLELTSGEMRLPMGEVSEETKRKIKSEMQRLSLI